MQFVEKVPRCLRAKYCEIIGERQLKWLPTARTMTTAMIESLTIVKPIHI